VIKETGVQCGGELIAALALLQAVA